MSSKLFKNLVINAYKKQVENELKERSKKKGILIKLLNANRKRSSKLVEILKETEHQNVNTHTGTTAQKSDEEFLKRYSQMGKGGPKHSIAVSRAHHLTNFLSE
jgi:oligoribonuclease NrnB/cAMP/cGMP phosphodiesterase (DHH superfamily)